MKDTLIIEHLRRGDEEAFKYIYERHYVLLCRFANQILNDAALSEEVVDDAIFYLGTFIKYYKISQLIHTP